MSSRILHHRGEAVACKLMVDGEGKARGSRGLGRTRRGGHADFRSIAAASSSGISANRDESQMGLRGGGLWRAVPVG